MTYKELQNQLKTFKSQGLTSIALNAKKDILEVEYNRVMNQLVKDAQYSEYEDNEDLVTEDLGKEVSAIEVINEAVTNPPVLNEPMGKEFIEALSKLLIIFVRSIVKLWVKVNRISRLVSGIKRAKADMDNFTQWYFSGFKLPEFV